MIVYFTKQYQAVPALWPLYHALGGVFVTTRPSTRRALRRVYPGTRVALLREAFGRFSRGDELLRQADAIVTGSPNRALLSRYSAEKYMVFHGTYAFMSKVEIDGLRHFDHICVIGPRMYDVLAGAGLQDKLFHSGYLPFLDFPERDPDMRHEFLLQAGLDPAAKTLLYLPRGKPYGSWDVMAEKLLKNVPSQYNLILRPHPSQSVTARIKDRLGFMRLQRLRRERGNALLDLTSCKLSTLFAISDLVITDGASSPEEALYYDLPLLFVESAGSSRDAIAAMMRSKEIQEEYIAKLLTIYDCGMRMTPDSRDMAQIIDASLAESDHFQPQREAYFKWVFGDRSKVRQQNLIRQLALFAD
ncbi:hypothetical protein [Tepidiphilus olei]|uniref:hypothetical protein n=1 Tax=Tepidiphilus olei TaxID=2502184 RepID=UPI00115DB098|nr:hypothetical protein [Tepidiphilus olei]